MDLPKVAHAFHVAFVASVHPSIRSTCARLSAGRYTGSLLTGLFPLNLGYDNVIHDSEPMGVPLDLMLLPQALQKAGFATHLLGKWHIGMYRPALLPINRGV